MRALGILTLSTALLTGCSLTTASGLTECETSADCEDDEVCTSGFCLPQPIGCGVSEGDSSPDAVQIGAVLPLSVSATNPNAGTDASEVQGLNAILLALKSINERGAAGKKLRLHVCDTAFDTDRAAKQTEWLITEKKVVALLTAGSTQTLAAAAISLPAGVLTMSSSATSPELTKKEDNSTLGLLWRTSPSDVIQGKVIANLLLTDPRFNTAQKVGLIHLDDLYGQGLRDVLLTELGSTAKNPTVVSYALKDEAAITAAVTELDRQDPDLTIVVGFEDDASLIIKRAANSTNLKAGSGHRWFFTDSAKDAQLLQDATVRGQIQGAYGTAPAQGVGLAFNSFRSTFITDFKADPLEYSFTSHSYDSMYLLGLGVAYSQGTSNAVTSLKIAEGLTQVSNEALPPIELAPSKFTETSGELAAGRSINVEGASGSLQFNEAGEAPSPIELWRVVDDGFQREETISPPP
ncbi:MAG: ABC transporter substrate-binding protein [Myxococcaceae bacterium]|nr:ABC transporter substrate-binding protein [Myxococcaceae bacterium]